MLKTELLNLWKKDALFNRYINNTIILLKNTTDKFKCWRNRSTKMHSYKIGILSRKNASFINSVYSLPNI